MPGVKLVVIYPRPLDEAAFETVYKNEHMPLAEEKLKGMTRLVASRVLGSPQGNVTTYRFAEVHFSSMDDLNKCAESEDGKAVVAHATKISTGGPPIILVCEEESKVYW
ncbi:MAG: EthD family reductase [Bryobacteraceae bacterium]